MTDHAAEQLVAVGGQVAVHGRELDARAVHPDHVPRLTGARVVLVDDVRTTGATLNNAAQALQHAGVADIGALVLARTPSD